MALSTHMNPDGLSDAALARLERVGGSADDLPLPDLDDHAAVAVWRRAQHDAWGEDHEPGEARHVPTSVGGVACLVADPSEPTAADPVTVLHFHSGGFCLGSPGTDIPITARFATQLRVVSIDYALAPERPFPAALDDGLAVYRDLSSDGPVALSGISAGANLAIGVALRASDMGLRSPQALALMSPLVDLSTEAPLPPLFGAYVGNADRADPALSPLLADGSALARLAPTLIQVTSAESLYGDAEAFAQRLHEHGVDVTVQVWWGLWHAWHYHRELPEAHDAVDIVTAFLGDDRT